jgi:hypothetical protein
MIELRSHAAAAGNAATLAVQAPAAAAPAAAAGGGGGGGGGAMSIPPHLMNDAPALQAFVRSNPAILESLRVANPGFYTLVMDETPTRLAAALARCVHFFCSRFSILPILYLPCLCYQTLTFVIPFSVSLPYQRCHRPSGAAAARTGDGVVGSV